MGENWKPIYQDKPAAPVYDAELLSLECPLDFAISYSTIFAADNTTGKQSWKKIQDLFYACGYFCASYYYVDERGNDIQMGTPKGNTCDRPSEFSRQMTGTYCVKNVPDEAE